MSYENQNFDELLQELWKTAQDNGICKYKLKIKCKKVSGKFDFVVQSSSQRKGNRRSPQIFDCVNVPFDENKFNFSNISLSEILFHIKFNQTNCNGNFVHVDSNIDSLDMGSVAVVNVSPFASGHMLLVPQLQECRPQILTDDALKLALQLQMMSKSCNFISVYNSMCGQASVNHLHLHCYYLTVPDASNELLIQRVDSLGRQLSNNCFVFESLPVPAFYFEITRHCAIDVISRDVSAIVNHLVKRNIAHNLSIVKGNRSTPASAINGNDFSEFPVLKVFLWPRKKVYRRDADINVGACELSGHVFVPDELYDTITESEVLHQIETVKLPSVEFEILADEVKEILKFKSQS